MTEEIKLTHDEEIIQTLASLVMALGYESEEEAIKGIAFAVHQKIRTQYMAEHEGDVARMNIIFNDVEITKKIRESIIILKNNLLKARLIGNGD